MASGHLLQAQQGGVSGDDLEQQPMRKQSCLVIGRHHPGALSVQRGKSPLKVVQPERCKPGSHPSGSHSWGHPISPGNTPTSPCPCVRAESLEGSLLYSRQARQDEVRRVSSQDDPCPSQCQEAAGTGAGRDRPVPLRRPRACFPVVPSRTGLRRMGGSSSEPGPGYRRLSLSTCWGLTSMDSLPCSAATSQVGVCVCGGGSRENKDSKPTCQHGPGCPPHISSRRPPKMAPQHSTS